MSVNKKHLVITTSCLLICVAGGSYFIRHSGDQVSRSQNLSDEALLALIKNDQSAFESFIKKGGSLDSQLPAIDGMSFTVAEGLAYFERVEFVRYLQKQKIPFFKQSHDGSPDMLSMAVEKNNPELFKLILNEKPDLTETYGENGASLLHLASSRCSHGLTDLLHKSGKFDVHQKQKDGTSAMTQAAAGNCLPMLSYWKEKKEDFTKKDGKGKNALSVLKQNKDAAAAAFVASFEPSRMPASVTAAAAKPVVPNFYNKRKTPKEELVDYSALVEPEIRPLDAVDTAEFSEFAD